MVYPKYSDETLSFSRYKVRVSLNKCRFVSEQCLQWCMFVKKITLFDRFFFPFLSSHSFSLSFFYLLPLLPLFCCCILGSADVAYSCTFVFLFLFSQFPCLFLCIWDYFLYFCLLLSSLILQNFWDTPVRYAQFRRWNISMLLQVFFIFVN